MLAIDTFDY